MGWCWAPSIQTLFGGIYQTWIWIYQKHRISYCFGSRCVTLYCILVKHMLLYCSHIYFFMKKIEWNILELIMFETQKYPFLEGCRAICHFFATYFFFIAIACLAFFWCYCIEAPLSTEMFMMFEHVFRRIFLPPVVILNHFNINIYHVTPIFFWLRGNMIWYTIHNSKEMYWEKSTRKDGCGLY